MHEADIATVWRCVSVIGTGRRRSSSEGVGGIGDKDYVNNEKRVIVSTLVVVTLAFT